jgi:hypothetical protein
MTALLACCWVVYRGLLPSCSCSEVTLSRCALWIARSMTSPTRCTCMPMRRNRHVTSARHMTCEAGVKEFAFTPGAHLWSLGCKRCASQCRYHLTICNVVRSYQVLYGRPCFHHVTKPLPKMQAIIDLKVLVEFPFFKQKWDKSEHTYAITPLPISPASPSDGRNALMRCAFAAV